jgi:hypothetical protein
LRIIGAVGIEGTGRGGG